MSKAIVTALMTLAIACPTVAELNSDEDFQYWDITAIEGKINDRWKASIDTEFRVGDNASKFYYQELVLAQLGGFDPNLIFF